MTNFNKVMVTAIDMLKTNTSDDKVLMILFINSSR